MEECLKKEKSLEVPVTDDDIHVFAATVASPDTGHASTSDTDHSTDHQEEPPNLDSKSVFDLMDHFGVNEDQLANSQWDEIMDYEADRQRKQKRGTKAHCREVFVESAAAVESQTA